MTNYQPIFYPKSSKNLTPKGLVHIPDERYYKTLCGKNITEKWFIDENEKVNCSKCLKFVKNLKEEL